MNVLSEEARKVQEQRTVQVWMSRLKPNSAKNGLWILVPFAAWLKDQGGVFSDKTLDDLVEFQKNVDNAHRYDVLDLVQRFVLSLEKKRLSYKQTVYTYLRSYFTHNRVELPRDTSFLIRSDVEKVYGALTVEDLRKIILSCDRLHQAIFLSMFQAGLGRAEFHYWNEHGWPALRLALEREDQIIKIDLLGRKLSRNTRPFYSFIGPDTIQAIRNYLPERPRDAKAIFVNDKGEALGRHGVYYYWLNHLK
ncbi:hypothetical protein MUP77_20985, partial [Candidatus Bathyarchaeota archaeon]|nr:hypothetical protein [Candidatus Bathyarchaeota archaeon]